MLFMFLLLVPRRCAGLGGTTRQGRKREQLATTGKFRASVSGGKKKNGAEKASVFLFVGKTGFEPATP